MLAESLCDDQCMSDFSSRPVLKIEIPDLVTSETRLMLKRHNEVFAESLAAMISPATQALARQLEASAALALEPLLAQHHVMANQVMAATGLAETARRISIELLSSLAPLLEQVRQINEVQLAVMRSTLLTAAEASTAVVPDDLEPSEDVSPFRASDWNIALTLLPSVYETVHGLVAVDEMLKNILLTVLLYTLVMMVRDVRERGWAPGR